MISFILAKHFVKRRQVMKNRQEMQESKRENKTYQTCQLQIHSYSGKPQKATIVIGLIAVVVWTAHGIQTNNLKCSSLLAGSSFFIYAYHGIPIALLVKLWVKLMQPATEVTMILGYILKVLSKQNKNTSSLSSTISIFPFVPTIFCLFLPK